MKKMIFFAIVGLVSLAGGSNTDSIKPILRVGSKVFTESYILAEIIAQTAERIGEAKVERKFGLGKTGIVFEAMKNGRIDLCPEYTGTIAETMLRMAKLNTNEAIRRELLKTNLTIGQPLGFNNTYALVVREKTSNRLKISTLSDLASHPELRAGFSHEFLSRQDGLPRLRQRYNLHFNELSGLEHSLAYEALNNDEVDVVDAYSTDAKIQRYRLHLLKDDRGVFPKYLAVILAQKNIAAKFPRTWKALEDLSGKINDEEMRHLNAMVELDNKSFHEVAAHFLGLPARAKPKFISEMKKLTVQHLELVFVSLVAAILLGIPLAIVASRVRLLAQFILTVSELVQTIPSLALLCFLIPLFGIGTLPALVALFLYSLLPIVRNTYVGITSIDPKLREVARAMALAPWQRLRLIELPMASPHIMNGVKTSAVINVGTATLAALIGAGGYGVPIVTGLALNDTSTILEGAIPAALMALLVHAFFELLDRLIIPKGIRH